MNPKAFKQFYQPVERQTENGYEYSFSASRANSFMLEHLCKILGKNVEISNGAKSFMIDESAKLVKPKLFLFDSTHVGIEIPTGVQVYQQIVNNLMGAEKGPGIYTVAFSRAFEVIRTVSSLSKLIPPFSFSDELTQTLLKPLEDFDGTISSLFSGNIENLFSVSYAHKATPEGFRDAGYNNIMDFILNKPRRYIDKTNLDPISNWLIGDDITFVGKIKEVTVVKNEHCKLEVMVGRDQITVMFWRRRWLADKLKPGEDVMIIGKYQRYKNVTGISIDSIMEAQTLPIVPVYKQSPKNEIKTKIIMNTVYEVFTRLASVTKYLADYIPNDKMSLQEAVYKLHFPKSESDYKEALETLALYELVYMQLIIKDKQMNTVKAKGISKPHIDGGLADTAEKALSFSLTNGQKQAIKKIGELMSTDTAEEALLSGDVGSGKSLVAELSCLQAVDNGYQAVLAGPTEVLAEQLYKGFVKLISGISADKRPSIVFLSGTLKAAEKRAIIKSIEYGEVDIIVGTHSVLNNDIKYHNLGVVLVDEQQKFGAEQRNALKDVRADGASPDIITQTATPIPRSTAQAFYGDINLIQLKEKPAGRKDIETLWIHEDPREIIKEKEQPIWKDIKETISRGEKVFVVVPMVYENEKMNIASVEDTTKKLNKIFKDVEIEYIHGKMKKKEQQEHLENFRSGNADILVASTVIEVGIDIPQATRMIVLSADRLGASSLHQIRGRVGRNSLDSKCYLVSANESKANEARLGSLVDSNDGFKIATVDLKTRGEGDLFGDRQSGDTNMRFANLVDYSDMITKAKDIANDIYNTPKRYIAINDAKAILGITEE